MYQAYGDPSLSGWINREMPEIRKSAGKPQETMPPHEADQLGSLCNSVV